MLYRYRIINKKRHHAVSAAGCWLRCLYRFLPASLLLLLIAGCDTQPAANTVNFALRLPDNSAFPREVDRSLFRVTVSVDQSITTMDPNNDFSSWRTSLLLPDDRAVQLVVEWFHANLLIARHSEMIGPVTEATTLTLTSDVYVTDGAEFDFDGDNISNLEELRQNTNPEDPQNIDVVIPRVSEAGTPGINGFGGVVWEATNSVDWRGNPLLIDNLMIDAGADHEDGATGYRWQALHNDENLFLIVFAEFLGNETPNADSQIAVRDDALNIYIDGNNSKQTSYDGVDDYHIVIPLFKLLKPAAAFEGSELVFDENQDIVRAENGDIKIKQSDGQELFVAPGSFQENVSLDADRRVQRGSESLPAPESIAFENGWNQQEQQVYEVKIKLSDVGITVGQPFGFELQLDDDTDGAGRNARYGWWHPSRNAQTNMDFNQSSKNPTFMGTAILQ